MRRSARRALILLCGLAAAPSGSGAQAAGGPVLPTEADFLGEMPVVLSVTRLAQPLDEVPGAVTVLDRDAIRRSGARELADVLRLVPGYFVAGFNGANPGAVYHAPIDDLGSRNLILVDGRPLYSSFLIGDTHRGLMGVMLEDIERIEVLRGSNSAAYGASAMFGVINIITRSADDTPGVELSVTGGEGGTEDRYARYGWRGDTASVRFSAGHREDNGYASADAFDDKRVNLWRVRGDVQLAPDQDLTFAIGGNELNGGDGFDSRPTNPPRNVSWRDYYAQGQWRRQLSESEEIRLGGSYSVEFGQDKKAFTLVPGVDFPIQGRGRRVHLEGQHSFSLNPELRAVWGAGYRYEDARSGSAFASDTPVSFHEEKVFGSLEWRPHPQWVVNAAGYLADHSRIGNYFAPRLMANFHLTPEHTFRLGSTKSVRAPTLAELDGNIQFHLNDVLIGRAIFAQGNAREETLFSHEAGYFGNLRALNMTIDLRVFQERLVDRIATRGFRLPVRLPATGRSAEDFVNRFGLDMRGFEYQARWHPREDTEIWLNQTIVHQSWKVNRDDNLAPTHASTVALFQKLPGRLDLSVMLHSIGSMTWRNGEDRLPARRRVDVRLAWPFRVGNTRAEVAMTVQAANGDYAEFAATQGFEVERRAFASVRLEM